MKNFKQIIALLLAIVMCFGLLAACGKKPVDQPGNTDKPGTNEPTNPANPDEPAPTYTYNTYTESLGTNWNPHTWETNADSSIMSYIEAPLADMTIKDSTTGEYQWIMVAAESIEDVTAANQADLTKYGCLLPEGVTADQVTADYVYEIKLRPEMCWEDGTPINADTYIYSMEQLLSPDMMNYRANNYYSGSSAVAGAYKFFSSNLESSMVGWSTQYASVDAALADGAALLVDCWNFWGAEGYTDADGNACPQYVAIDDTTVYGESVGDAFSGADLFTVYGSYLTTIGSGYESYLVFEKANPNYNPDGWDFAETVGVYKVDDYTIHYVCESAYARDYFLTSCTSNWIVHEELYESCKDFSGSLVTSTYGTSADTTMSYGAYKIESLQDEKQLVFVQNDKYFEYTVAENGNLASTSETIGFTVDGEYVPQYMTQKIVIDVMTSDAAKLAFLSGKLDDWTPAADEVVEYTTSDQLYQVDETYTMRLFFNCNLDALKAMDQAGNTNSVVMSNIKFRQAMSLAINRAEFVTATAGYKAAYSVLNSLYFYNVYEDPSSIYRNTDQAKQAVVNLYGIAYGEGEIYATLDEAYESITGYNVTEAKALFTEACAELVEAGLYTAGDPIVIEMGWMAGAMDSSNTQQVTLLNQYMNAALEGTGFGTIELKGIDNLSNRYKDVPNGVYAIGWGAWGGAAFYPFTMFRVYCDPDYADLHEAGCWNPAVETLTLNVNGEDVTMTWQAWANCMEGTGPYANADEQTKLSILAAIEENILKLYYFIPVCATTACSMLSYKLSYYTENYSIMYGFGGLRLINHNYSDAEWAEYVAEQGGQLAY